MIAICPSHAELAGWLEGAGPVDGLAEHVASCAHCQTILDQLSDDPELRIMAHALSAFETDEDGCTLPREGLGRRGKPDRIGPYRLVAEIGHGGMGVVYCATDDVLHRTVALKLMRRETVRDRDRERLLREARSAARVQHDNIVGIYAAGVADDGSPYLAMEYVPGPSLADIIKKEKRLVPRVAAALIAQVADGLAAAHAAGLVHRDVKPSNILVADGQNAVGGNGVASSQTTGQTRTHFPKLADFGLVRDDLATSVLTVEGTIAGTPAYLSPEQARGGTADARSDVYGLGVTLYESLIGEVPFRGPPVEVMRQVLDDEPRPPSQIDHTIPPDLETIVLKSLAKEPSRRYPSATEFANDLRRWLRNEPILARPAGRIERSWRWCRRNPKSAALTGLVASLLVTLAAGGTTAAVLISRAYGRADIDRNNAIASQKQAEADFDVALKSLNTLVETVQTQMGTQPGLLPIKRQLLETAADGLNKVIASQTDSSRTDQLVTIAHHRLGDVYADLGRTADAKREFEAALQQSESWAAREPNNVNALRGQANACDRLGDYAWQAKVHTAALDWYKKAVEIRGKVIAMAPDDIRVTRDISVSHNKIGDAEKLAGHWDVARQHFEESLRMIGERPADADAKLRILDSRFTNSRLSDACVTLGDYEAARCHAEAALENARDYVKMEPIAARVEMANALERRAWVATNTFDAATAVSCRRESVELRRATAEADPGNAMTRRNVAYALSQFADALLASGDFAAAREPYVESLHIYAKELSSDPASAQLVINLCIAYQRVISIDASLGRYADATEWADQAAKFCQLCNENSKLPHPELSAYLDSLLGYHAIFEFASQKGLADPASFSSEPIAVRRKLLCLRAFQLAQQGRNDDAVAAVADLNITGNSFEAIIAARVLAKLGQAEKAIAALRESIRLEPALARDLAIYPEFYSLSQNPNFLALRPKPAGAKN
jgi:serine/threonine protein kinase/tetratricopeptide (TPR) repeat protein